MMNKKTDKTKEASYEAIFTFLASIAVCSLVIVIMALNRHSMDSLKTERLIMNKSIEISNVISKLLYKTQALAAYVIQSDGEVKDFDRVAAAIVDDPAILNVLLAPDGIVSKVYPLEGNEAVIGLNFFADGDGNKEAVRARDAGELVFGGPFNLIQGGQALVGRMPIYIEDGYKEKSFWGIASVTLKYPDVLKGINLSDLESEGLAYAIWRINPDTNQEQIIASNSNYNHNQRTYIEKTVRILNAEWYFRIVTVTNWYSYPELWVMGIAGLCISVLLFFSAKRKSELRISQINLENKVTEITRLAKEVEDAKEGVERASRAKSVFLANISHEIRTPMNGILGFTELAAVADVTPAELNDYLSKMRNSVERLLRIMNDIIYISELETGTLELSQTPFDLVKVVQTCMYETDIKASEKGVELYVSIDPRITKLFIGDPKGLRQILLSLLSNAIRSTDIGFVELTVTMGNIANNEAVIDFEIKGNGIGMARVQIDNVFETLAKDDGANNKRHDGGGIGFSVVQKLLKQMGSFMEVESMLGTGTVFRFQLKLPMADTDAEVAATSEEESKRLSFVGSVLVCEDDETSQMVTQMKLEKMGFIVTIASDGRYGVELAKKRIEVKNPFDIIFMDIYMPIMDGIQAALMLKQIGSESPIVALTANTADKDIDGYKENGISSFLEKPLKTEELQDCILQYIQPRSAVIDKDTAIEHYDGDSRIYKQVLYSFVKNHRDTLNRLMEAIEQGEISLAHRITHTLSGAAGAIGAMELAKVAKKTEKLLKSMMDVEIDLYWINTRDDILALLEKEFDLVFADLKSLNKESDERIEKGKQVYRENILELMDKLVPLLETGDSKSLDYLCEVKAICQPLAASCRLLITQIEQCDFDLACETVKTIRRFYHNGDSMDFLT